MNNKIIKQIAKWLICLLIAFAASIMIRTLLFNISPVENISMQPALYPGDIVFIDLLHYKFNGIKHNDIIAFSLPNQKNSKYVKRIIGLPGERVKVTNGSVYINDSKLNEGYLTSDTYTEGDIDITLAEGEVFVMGDNRNNSEDSRDFGPVSISNIKGNILFRILPFKRMQRF